MWELLLALGITAGLAGLGGLALLPWETALALGQVLLVWGLGLGVPTGLVYHVQLARALRRRRLLPRGWYWQPLRLHGALLPEERAGVLAWCGAGALGFALTALGLLVLVAPMALALLRGG